MAHRLPFQSHQYFLYYTETSKYFLQAQNLTNFLLNSCVFFTLTINAGKSFYLSKIQGPRELSEIQPPAGLFLFQQFLIMSPYSYYYVMETMFVELNLHSLSNNHKHCHQVFSFLSFKNWCKVNPFTLSYRGSSLMSLEIFLFCLCHWNFCLFSAHFYFLTMVENDL